MRVEELREDLAAAARDVGQLTPDAADRVRRRVRRRRARAATVAAFVVVTAISATVVTLVAGDDGLDVATTPGPGTKEVSLSGLHGPEVLVAVPDGDVTRTRDTLDASAAVERYAFVPGGFSTLVRDAGGWNPVTGCNDLYDPVFLVDLDWHVAHPARRLATDVEPARVRTLEGKSLASAVPSRWREGDLEVFLDADADPATIEGLRQLLDRADGVASYRYVSKQDAWEELQRIFAGEPDLLENARPEDLPPAFRVRLTPDTNWRALRGRLDGLAGVAGVTVAPRIRWAEIDVTVVPPGRLTEPGRLEVFMEVDATDAQIDAVRRHLERDPDVASHRYLSKQDAWDEFQRAFADVPAVLPPTDPASFAASFRVEPGEGVDLDALKARLDALPGVDEVVMSACRGEP